MFENAVTYFPKEFPDVGLLLPDVNMRNYFSGCEGGFPEAPLIRWALDTFAPRNFWDVGAHVGTWSIPFAATPIVHQVRSFEANPLLYRCLCASTGLSDIGYPEIFVGNWAITSNELVGPDAIFTMPYQDGGGASMVVHFDTVADVFAAPTKTLDQVIETVYFSEWPDLLKIDVEGAELDVLRGATFLNEHLHHTKILFECWNDERGQRKEDLFRYIHDTMHYQVVPVAWPETYLAEPLDT